MYLSTGDKNGFLLKQLVMCGETLPQSHITLFDKHRKNTKNSTKRALISIKATLVPNGARIDFQN